MLSIKEWLHLHKIKSIFFILVFNLSILANANTIASQPYLTMDFNKPIDYQDWLEKIKLPFPELINKLQEQIILYRFSNAFSVDLKSDTRPELMKLQIIPETLKNLYKQDLTIGKAQAIYIPKNEVDLESNKTPIILLRDDSDHWTLIHEYTHHLFNQARKNTNMELPANYILTFNDSAEALQEYYQKFQNNNNSFNSTTDESGFLDCLLIATDLMLKINISTSIEEIVIEKMIREFYKKNLNLPDAPDQENLNNSKKYTESSLKRVQTTVIIYKDIIKNYMSANRDKPSNLYKKSEIFILALEKQLDDLNQKIQNFKY